MDMSYVNFLELQSEYINELLEKHSGFPVYIHLDEEENKMLKTYEELNMQQFGNYIFKVTKKWIKVYRETKSKIVLCRKIVKSYEGIRELNREYDTNFSIIGMPLYLKDFKRPDGSYVVEDFNKLTKHEGLNQVVGVLLDEDTIQIGIPCMGGLNG